MEYTVIIILLIIVVIYEKLFMEPKHFKKIRKHIEFMGGEILSIEKISHREKIYSVMFILDEEEITKTVKFSLLYGEEWYW